MKRLYTLVLVIAVLSTACSKSHNAVSTTTGTDTTTFTPDPPDITPVGTPIGSAVTKSIGTSGGSLASADGRIVVTIPANALSATTTIGIQAVTNQSPGGIGVAYHLMPDGTKFATPATLLFHYADSDVLGSQPYLLYIAFQDSTNAWEADFANRNIGTTAKTATEEISHFSLWALGDRLHLVASPDDLKKDQTSTANVIYDLVPPHPVKGANGDIELYTLGISKPVPDADIMNWSVNGAVGGNATVGTIVGPGAMATYTSPARIEKKQTVQLSAEVYLLFDVYNNKQLVNSPAKFILFADVTLEPDPQSFMVEIDLTINNTSGVYNDVYTDAVTMRVDIIDAMVVVSGIRNQAPTVTPAMGFGGGNLTATWVPDETGFINVTQGIGIVTTDAFTGGQRVNITLVHSGTVDPQWFITDGMGYTNTTGGDQAPGLPPAFDFVVEADPQEIVLPSNDDIVVKITPIDP